LYTAFDKAARFESLSANLYSESGLPPQRILVTMVTPQFFSTLGVTLSVGRDFTPEMQPASNLPESLPSWLPIIISDKLWRTDFGANAKIVGQSITLNVRPYRFQVIGVAPAEVSFPSGTEAWVPEHSVSYTLVQAAGERGGGVIGLLQARLSIAAAKAEFKTWPQHSRNWLNWDSIDTEQLIPLRAFLGGTLYRLGPTLWLATIFFLVLTVATAMSILEIDMEMRATEFHIRRILGATPARLFRSLSFETGAVLVLGIASSFVVHAVLIRFTSAYLGLAEPPLSNTRWIDVAMAAAVATIVFLATAISSGRHLRLLSFSRRDDARARRIQRFRLPVQIVPATLILITAVMLVRSSYRLVHTQPGVQPANAFICETALRLNNDQMFLQAADLKLPLAERSKKFQENVRTFNQRVNGDYVSMLQQLKKEGGVTDDGAISISPYRGREPGYTYAYYSRAPGRPQIADFIDHTFERSMTPKAISALGMKLLCGRDFSGDEGADQATVLVNDALAEHLGRGCRALGQYLRLGSPDLPPSRVVGVVDNVHEKDLYSPEEPTVYYPFTYRPVTDVDVVVRTSGNVPNEDVFHMIQAAARSAVPDATVSHFAPLTRLVQSGTQWTNYSAYFLLALALLGVFLAGICAWAKAVSEVRRREHEIGVRLALGAVPRQIVGMIAGTQVILTLLAALIGAILTFWFAHFMSYLFYQVTPSDPLSYAIGIGVIALYVAVITAWSVSQVSLQNPQELMREGPFA
jgi:putative ABC transport system permease protein